MHTGETMFFYGGMMWFFWIAIFIASIWIIKIMLTALAEKNANLNNTTSIERLKLRYASGEIDESEFNRRRLQLKE